MYGCIDDLVGARWVGAWAHGGGSRSDVSGGWVTATAALLRNSGSALGSLFAAACINEMCKELEAWLLLPLLLLRVARSENNCKATSLPV